jgi:prefoldin subunit 5
MASPEEQGGLDLKRLSPQQLQQLGQQLQQDLQTLSESAGKLQSAVSRFHQSGVALETFAEEKPGAQAHGTCSPEH